MRPTLPDQDNNIRVSKPARPEQKMSLAKHVKIARKIAVGVFFNFFTISADNEVISEYALA